VQDSSCCNDRGLSFPAASSSAFDLEGIGLTEEETIDNTGARCCGTD